MRTRKLFSCGSWLIKCLCIFLLCPVAQAGLTWESKAVQLNLHPVQVTGAVEFSFKNSGTNAVDILSVRTACGCLQAAVSTNRVDAGESGAIHVTFDFHDKTGPQRKGVAVRTSDSKPVFLYVEANVPEAYSLDTERIEWSMSEASEPKTCRLVNHLEDPVRLVSVSSSAPQFVVELKPIREGFEYEVKVCPVESASPCLGVIAVQAECPAELPESRVYTFIAALR